MTEEEEERRAFDAVRERVEAGEYLNRMRGLPGEDLEGGGPAGPVWAADPNPPPVDELAAALFPQDMTLATWLLRWTQDRLHQPWLVRDPDSGRWRGFTEAEWEA